MLSKPWAATVLGLVSVNDGPFGIATYSDREQLCHSLLTFLNLQSCSNKIIHFIPQAILPFDVLFQTYPEAL